MRLYILLGFAFLLLGCVGNNDKGLSLYEKGIKAESYKEYPIALKYFESACKEGFSGACQKAARMHQKGIGTKVDHQIALELLDDGCNKWNNPRVCSSLATYVVPQEAEAKSQQRYETYMNKACHLGLPFICRELALEALNHNKADVFKYMQFACEAQHGKSLCTNEDIYYFSALFFEHNNYTQEAMESFKKACQLKHKDSCLEMGKIAQRTQRYEESIKAFEQACALGAMQGCSSLAISYDQGSMGLLSHQKAATYREILCVQGGVYDECILVAQYYQQQDEKKSKEYYKKALQLCEKSHGDCSSIQEHIK